MRVFSQNRVGVSWSPLIVRGSSSKFFFFFIFENAQPRARFMTFGACMSENMFVLFQPLIHAPFSLFFFLELKRSVMNCGVPRARPKACRWRATFPVDLRCHMEHKSLPSMLSTLSRMLRCPKTRLFSRVTLPKLRCRDSLAEGKWCKSMSCAFYSVPCFLSAMFLKVARAFLGKNHEHQSALERLTRYFYVCDRVVRETPGIKNSSMRSRPCCGHLSK